TEGVMGKGIALQFSKKFPEMFEAYKRACKAGEVRLGKMHVVERTDMLNPRYIINFPTKGHWRSRSRIEDIEAGLAALAGEIRKRGIKSIAVPPLGCGNGGLDWRVVRPAIERALAELPEVRVLLYAPAGAPDAAEIVHRTERPAMNPSRAIVLKIWNQYFVLGYQLTLLEIHKLLYFLQESGEELRLRFAKDRYGPYADNLRHLLHLFEGHFTLGFADGRNQPDTQIQLRPGAIEEANKFLEEFAEESRESLQRLQRVAELIEGFESPYGMELLATVHWAATRERTLDPSVAGVRLVIEKWSPRKRKLIKPEHIELAWQQLKRRGWLN
ncbi:MAG: type II toxin-antitoxin system antitoxin DNA ADP-ribosyl glycohydrolase DarG, partial [Terriglobia bacterium]